MRAGARVGRDLAALQQKTASTFLLSSLLLSSLTSFAQCPCLRCSPPWPFPLLRAPDMLCNPNHPTTSHTSCRCLYLPCTPSLFLPSLPSFLFMSLLSPSPSLSPSLPLLLPLSLTHTLSPYLPPFPPSLYLSPSLPPSFIIPPPLPPQM